MKIKFLLPLLLSLTWPLLAVPVKLNGTFDSPSPGAPPDNWGKTYHINGTLTPLKNAIKASAKNDSFYEESTKFEVVPGALLKLELKAEGIGDVGFLIQIFNAPGEQIFQTTTAAKIKPEGSFSRADISIKPDYSGKIPASARVGIFFRKGTEATIRNFKADYTATPLDMKRPENRTDWAAGTYKTLTALAEKKQNIPVMFLGDSITQLWEFAPTNRFPGGLEVWNEYFKPMGALNFGVSGDTVQNVLYRITEGKQLACRPRVIVLLIGTNNLHQAPVAAPEQIVQGVDNLLRIIRRELPDTRVLLLGVLPRKGNFPIEALNAGLKKAADSFKSTGKVTFMDVSSALLRGKKEVDPAVFRDGLHLSPLGYRLFAEAIAPEVRRQLALSEEEYPSLTEKKSPCSIVLPPDASPAERNAARELQIFLSRATGETPEIVNTVPSSSPAFLLGQSEEIRKLLPNIDFSKLKPNEILLERQGNRLILTGGRPRGTLNAVYEFAEKYLGVKFYSSTETEVPRLPNFNLPEVHFRYAPPVEYRSAMYHDLMWTFPRFGVRLRNNGDFLHGMKDWGCDAGYIVPCHSFNRLIPAEKYFKTHPEFFSLVDGQRSGGQSLGQLCLTNPEVKKELVKNLLEIIRANPGKGNRVSVSQNDNTRYCSCDDCLKSDQKYGGPSGTLLNFVNDVAAEVGKEFPDVRVETFAYQYTSTPPKNIRPRNNVSILLCSISSNCAQKLDSDANASFRDELNGWKDLAGQLSIWSYVANFSNYLTPFPNLRNFASDVRFFARSGAKSILAQGDWNSGGAAGDYVALRAWLFSKLMWNPDQDTDALIREFTDGYYGPAAPTIREYWILLDNEAADNQAYLGCFTNLTSKWLSLETLLKAYGLMRRAEKSVEKSPWPLRERVLLASQPIKYAMLERSSVLKEKFPEKCPDFDALFLEVRNVALRNRTNKFQENASADRLFQWLETEIHRPKLPEARPAEAVKNLPKGSFTELQSAFFYVEPWSKHLKRVSDPAASDGEALRTDGTVYTWNMQFPPNLDYFPMRPGKYRLIVSARCEGEGAEGLALEAGSYDVRRKIITAKNIPLKDAKSSTYQEFDLGVHELNPNCYLFVAPKRNPGMKWLYVDRLTVIPVSGK